MIYLNKSFRKLTYSCLIFLVAFSASAESQLRRVETLNLTKISDYPLLPSGAPEKYILISNSPNTNFNLKIASALSFDAEVEILCDGIVTLKPQNKINKTIRDKTIKFTVTASEAKASLMPGKCGKSRAE